MAGVNDLILPGGWRHDQQGRRMLRAITEDTALSGDVVRAGDRVRGADGVEEIVLEGVALDSSTARTSARASIQYVEEGGSDANDGKSWGRPKATLAAAHAALGSSGGRIEFAGLIDEPDAATMTKCVTLVGLGAGVQPSVAAAVLRFEAGESGLIFAASAQKSRIQDLDLLSSTAHVATGTTTNGSADVTGVVAVTGTIAVGHRIAGAGIPAGTTVLAVGAGTLTLSANATASASGVALYSWSSNQGIGLSVQTHGLIADNVLVQGFGSHGVAIDSSAGANANGFDLRSVRAFGNGADGFLVVGNDSNTGVMTVCDAANNLGWGFRNFSFGNVLLLPQMENNLLGAAFDGGDSCRWIWPYIEGPPSVGQNVNLANATNYVWEEQEFGSATLTPTPSSSGSVIRASDMAATRKFFPVPTGADDAAELISRFAAGETDVALRRLTYLWAQAVAFPEAAMLTGAGKRKTIVEKAYNGDLGTLATGAGFAHLTFDGKGATRTGRGFVMAGGDGQQHAEHFRLIDCAGACLEFAHEAGSQSCWLDGDIWRFDDTAADAHAIVIEDNAALIAAHPRKFIGLESGGKKFIALGGCADLFISGGGYLGAILWSNNSRGVTINGQRIGGTVTPWVIRGFNHAIAGCDIGMPIEIAHGNPHTIAANTYNVTPGTPVIVDNSGFSHLNQLSIPRVAYTPAFTASGSAPSLGDGTLLGSYGREGVVVEFAIDFSVGSTTTFGTDGLRFSLPYTPQAPERQAIAGFLYDASANTYYTLVGVLAQNTAYVTMRADATPGELSGVSPIALAVGDTISLSGSYNL